MPQNLEIGSSQEPTDDIIGFTEKTKANQKNWELLMVPGMVVGIGLLQSEHQNIRVVGASLFVASILWPIVVRIVRERGESKD